MKLFSVIAAIFSIFQQYASGHPTVPGPQFQLLSGPSPDVTAGHFPGSGATSTSSAESGTIAGNLPTGPTNVPLPSSSAPGGTFLPYNTPGNYGNPLPGAGATSSSSSESGTVSGTLPSGYSATVPWPTGTSGGAVPSGYNEWVLPVQAVTMPGYPQYPSATNPNFLPGGGTTSSSTSSSGTVSGSIGSTPGGFPAVASGVSPAIPPTTSVLPVINTPEAPMYQPGGVVPGTGATSTSSSSSGTSTEGAMHYPQVQIPQSGYTPSVQYYPQYYPQQQVYPLVQYYPQPVYSGYPSYSRPYYSGYSHYDC